MGCKSTKPAAQAEPKDDTALLEAQASADAPKAEEANAAEANKPAEPETGTGAETSALSADKPEDAAKTEESKAAGADESAAAPADNAQTEQTDAVPEETTEAQGDSTANAAATSETAETGAAAEPDLEDASKSLEQPQEKEAEGDNIVTVKAVNLLGSDGEVPLGDDTDAQAAPAVKSSWACCA